MRRIGGVFRQIYVRSYCMYSGFPLKRVKDHLYRQVKHSSFGVGRKRWTVPLSYWQPMTFKVKC